MAVSASRYTRNYETSILITREDIRESGITNRGKTSMQKRLKAFVRRSVQLIAEYAEAGQRDHRNVEMVLFAAMREPGPLSGIRYPVG